MYLIMATHFFRCGPYDAVKLLKMCYCAALTMLLSFKNRRYKQLLLFS